MQPSSSSQTWTSPSRPAGHQAQLAAAATSVPQLFLRQEAARCWKREGCNTSAFQTAREKGNVPHGTAYMQGKAESSFIQSSFINYVGLCF